MAKRLPSGHGVAYLTLVLGMAASVTGNVSNILLTDSHVTNWLRVPVSVLWPVLTYLGIEILTRVDWSRTWQHWFARAILLGPMAIVSAFMSYLHLHHLMILSGEPGLAQAVGPLAIDGSLFGATVALLVTRHRARGQEDTTPKVSLAQRVANARQTLVAVKSAALDGATIGDTEPQVALNIPAQVALNIPALVDDMAQENLDNPMPVSPAPSVEDIRPRSPRPPRQSTLRNGWDAVKAVRLIQEGQLSNTEIGDLVGINFKMIQRTRRAVELIKSDPHATIPTEWKVPGPVAEVVRREIRAMS